MEEIREIKINEKENKFETNIYEFFTYVLNKEGKNVTVDEIKSFFEKELKSNTISVDMIFNKFLKTYFNVNDIKTESQDVLNETINKIKKENIDETEKNKIKQFTESFNKIEEILNQKPSAILKLSRLYQIKKNIDNIEDFFIKVNKEKKNVFNEKEKETLLKFSETYRTKDIGFNNLNEFNNLKNKIKSIIIKKELVDDLKKDYLEIYKLIDIKYPKKINIENNVKIETADINDVNFDKNIETSNAENINSDKNIETSNAENVNTNKNIETSNAENVNTNKNIETSNIEDVNFDKNIETLNAENINFDKNIETSNIENINPIKNIETSNIENINPIKNIETSNVENINPNKNIETKQPNEVDDKVAIQKKDFNNINTKDIKFNKLKEKEINAKKDIKNKTFENIIEPSINLDSFSKIINDNKTKLLSSILFSKFIPFFLSNFTEIRNVKNMNLTDIYNLLGKTLSLKTTAVLGGNVSNFMNNKFFNLIKNFVPVDNIFGNILKNSLNFVGQFFITKNFINYYVKNSDNPTVAILTLINYALSSMNVPFIGFSVLNTKVKEAINEQSKDFYKKNFPIYGHIVPYYPAIYYKSIQQFNEYLKSLAIPVQFPFTIDKTSKRVNYSDITGQGRDSAVKIYGGSTNISYNIVLTYFAFSKLANSLSL